MDHAGRCAGASPHPPPTVPLAFTTARVRARLASSDSVGAARVSGTTGPDMASLPPDESPPQEERRPSSGRTRAPLLIPPTVSTGGRECNPENHSIAPGPRQIERLARRTRRSVAEVTQTLGRKRSCSAVRTSRTRGRVEKIWHGLACWKSSVITVVATKEAGEVLPHVSSRSWRRPFLSKCRDRSIAIAETAATPKPGHEASLRRA